MKKILPATAILLLMTVPVFAEWYKDYEEGMDLIRKQNWSQAVPKLRAAIGQKSEEGSNIKFYGMKFGDYYPHYYLGLAFFNLQNFEAAMKELQISEQQGAIRKKSELSNRLAKMVVLAEAQLVAKSTPQVASNPPPQPVEEEKPVPPPQKAPPAQKEEVVKAEPLPEIQKTPAQQPPASPKTEKVIAPESTTEKPKSQPPVVLPPQNQPPIDMSVEMAKTMIRNGAARYFSGDYDTAISLLSSALDIQATNATAQFLLGCSFAAKYLLTGSRNEELLKSASAAFRRSKQIDPRFRVKNRTYFSPLVLEIYNNIS